MFGCHKSTIVRCVYRVHITSKIPLCYKVLEVVMISNVALVLWLFLMT